MKTLSLLVGLVLFSSNAMADGELQRSRFNRYFDKLELPLDVSKEIREGKDNEKRDRAYVVARNLLDKTFAFRGASFYLQELSKYYRKEDSGFEKIKDYVRNLENIAGEFDKQRGFFQKAYKKKDKKKLEKFKAEMDLALVHLAHQIEKDGWVESRKSDRRLEKLREFIKSYNFKSYEKDRALIIGGLIKYLEEELIKGKYDLGILQEGNGLHELRRDIRRVSVKSQALNGLIQLRSVESCPVAAFQDIKKKLKRGSEKYATLPEAQEGEKSCYISDCLFHATVWANQGLGDLKDDAEDLLEGASASERASDRTPKKIREAAQEIYDKVNNNKLILKLVEELRDCI